MSASEVLATVADNSFWADLKRAKESIEPLAVSCNVLQADGLRLDVAGLTVGNTFGMYGEPHVDPAVAVPVRESLEKRWNAADQEAFIVAIFLNPYVRADAFCDAALPPNALAETCARLFRRIMRSEPKPDTLEFWAACNRYRLSEGRFTALSMGLEMHRAMAEKEGKSIGVVRIWEGIRVVHTRSSADVADNSLADLAIRILSVVANSGACERCFSGFGVTHTARRNRLSVQSTHDINLVRMDIEAEHEAAGIAPARKKRRIGAPSTSTARADENVPQPSAPASASLSLEQPHDQDVDLVTVDELESLLQGADSLLDTGEEVPPNMSAAFTKIKLCDLFNYPTRADASRPLRFYWHGGVADLQAEEAEMDAAAAPPPATQRIG